MKVIKKDFHLKILIFGKNTALTDWRRSLRDEPFLEHHFSLVNFANNFKRNNKTLVFSNKQ